MHFCGLFGFKTRFSLTKPESSQVHVSILKYELVGSAVSPQQQSLRGWNFQQLRFLCSDDTRQTSPVPSALQAVARFARQNFCILCLNDWC